VEEEEEAPPPPPPEDDEEPAPKPKTKVCSHPYFAVFVGICPAVLCRLAVLRVPVLLPRYHLLRDSLAVRCLPASPLRSPLRASHHMSVVFQAKESKEAVEEKKGGDQLAAIVSPKRPTHRVAQSLVRTA
jgi:hypothetical protein